MLTACAESIILSACPKNIILLVPLAESIILSVQAESIILSAHHVESMILSAQFGYVIMLPVVATKMRVSYSQWAAPRV